MRTPRAALIAASLLVLSCTGQEQDPQGNNTGTADAGTPDGGAAGGTVINAPDNQAQRYVSTDTRYSSAWTFELRQQAALPTGAREVYVEVRACRHDYEPVGAMRFRTPESTSWRELSVDKPLCDAPGIPSTQVWLPVSEPPRLMVEAVRPALGADSYVLTTVKVLGWRMP